MQPSPHIYLSLHCNFKENRTYNCLPLDLCINTIYVHIHKQKIVVLLCFFRDHNKSNVLSAHYRGALLPSKSTESCWVLGSAEVTSAFLLSMAPREPCNSPIFLHSTVWAHWEPMVGFFWGGRGASVFLQWSCACKVIGNGISSGCLAYYTRFVGWGITWTGNSASLTDW